MTALTQESLMDCMRKVNDTRTTPVYFAVSYDFVQIADRILNPWKGKRALWLKGKR